MSILAVTWALQQRLKPTQKLVLLVLAHRHHQKTGQCNPSLATLVADTGLSRSAIKAALRDLGALKLVRSINRKSAGRDLSNQYQLLFENTTGCQCTGAGSDPQRGRDPTPGRGLEALGSAADPMGPGADPNKEGKRRKVPSQKEKWTQDERYRRGLRISGLVAIGVQRGYQPGWARNQYRQKFGAWPKGLSEIPAAETDQDVLNFVTASLIRFAKRRKVQEAAHA